jgi:hypothetical protein
MIFSVAFIGRMAALRRRIRSVVSGAAYDPYWDNVVLLLKGEGADGSATFIDSSESSHVVSVSTGARISQDEAKFGSTSMYFNGAGGATVSEINDFNFGSEDFTIEFFVLKTAAGDATLVSRWGSNDSSSVFEIIIYNNRMYFQTPNQNSNTTTLPPIGAWCHVAFCRNGGTAKGFINGVEVVVNASYSTTPLPSLATPLGIGVRPNGLFPLQGYIDELRITKGVARYTANFTPPTAPFPTVGAAVSEPGWPQAFIDGQTMGPSGPEVDHQYDPVSDTGYYGFVESADLITGDALASQIGLTAGGAQFSDSGWFKFYVGPCAACNRTSPKRPYVIYVASMPYRYSTSWDAINAVNAVYGDRIETIGSHDYRVRLIQGATTNPTATSYGTSCADDPGLDSEWNELFYRIHTDVPDCSVPNIGMPGGYATSRHGGPQSAGANWAEYTNTQTGVLNTINNGSASWAQESDGTDTSKRVYCGYTGVAFWASNTSSYANTYFGWRPVLEFVS